MPASQGRRWVKLAGYAILILLILVFAAISLTVGWRPFLGPRTRPVTDRKFEATPERLNRGEYLVEHVSLCFGCHTQFDAKNGTVTFTKPKGSGSKMTEQGSFVIVAPNITPDPQTGLGSWTDDEIARAIREGVSRDGHTLFPMMPYQNFRHMSDEDIASVVVYLRSIPAANNNAGRTQVPFPVSRLINGAPEPVTAPVPQPNPDDAVNYGKYLVSAVGDCDGCHTPRDAHGQAIPGMDLGGGNIFTDSGHAVATANITPDPSGIAYYDENLFVNVMRTGVVKARKLDPMMPTTLFSGMTDHDLKAIFAYLRTVPPAKHRVDNTEPPTHCRIDGQMHGGGDKN
jgi:hypothetical protein